jgi:hypothetical protein
MKQLHVAGSLTSHSRCPDPEGALFECACQLLEGWELDNPKLPDSAQVSLWEITWEEWVPPRCRKPRDRQVRKLLATYTLGEFRGVDTTAIARAAEGATRARHLAERSEKQRQAQ